MCSVAQGRKYMFVLMIWVLCFSKQHSSGVTRPGFGPATSWSANRRSTTSAIVASRNYLTYMVAHIRGKHGQWTTRWKNNPIAKYQRVRMMSYRTHLLEGTQKITKRVLERMVCEYYKKKCNFTLCDYSILWSNLSCCTIYNPFVYIIFYLLVQCYNISQLKGSKIPFRQTVIKFN